MVYFFPKKYIWVNTVSCMSALILGMYLTGRRDRGRSHSDLPIPLQWSSSIPAWWCSWPGHCRRTRCRPGSGSTPSSPPRTRGLLQGQTAVNDRIWKTVDFDPELRGLTLTAVFVLRQDVTVIADARVRARSVLAGAVRLAEVSVSSAFIYICKADKHALPSVSHAIRTPAKKLFFSNERRKTSKYLPTALMQESKSIIILQKVHI